MPLTPDGAALRDRIAGHFGADVPQRLAVAVSGGSDSTALLYLLRDWSLEGGPKIAAVTVDHGLRRESAQEARKVAETCRGLGVSHDVLRWQDTQASGNLADRARRARYALMADWAQARGVNDIAIGHTSDDQAETLLMRLARQAGLDGLAAMAPVWTQGGVRFHRPALSLSRAALRDMLARRGLGWIDDPSNDDPAYRRVRARQALAALAPLGVTAEGLAQVASHLAEARRTLGYYASQEARRIVAFPAGDVTLARAALLALPDDIARRILQAALKWVSGAGYGARGVAVEQALEALRAGAGLTLHGCRVTVEANHLRIAREYAAVAGLRSPLGAVWDGRWHVSGPGSPGMELRALGPAGRMLCPDWRATGLPRHSVEAGPAVWQADRLIAAPLAGLGCGWTLRLGRNDADFHALLTGFALK